MKETKQGTLLILIAGLMWGTAGLFVRGLNAVGLSAMQVVFVRVAITAALILAGVLIYDRSLLKIRLRDLWCFLGTGLLSILFFYYCYFATIETASLAVAAVLLYTAPIFVMLLSLILFREKLTLQKTASCLMAFVGCMLVAGILEGGERRLLPGSLLTGLLSGVGYALYSIFSRYAINKGYSSITITAYTFLIAALGLLPFADYGLIGGAIAAAPGRTLLLALGLAVFVTVIPYLLYTRGLETVASSRASIMASVEPAMACVVSICVYREIPSLLGVVGILLVIGAVMLLNLQRRGKADVN